MCATQGLAHPNDMTDISTRDTGSGGQETRMLSASPAPTLAHPLVELGPFSSPAIPDSLFYAPAFLLGVGVVVIQPATGKVVIINDPKEDLWFLPKGRKDMAESLQQAALREAYEESGYRASFMPVFTPTQAPVSADVETGSTLLNTEPFYVSTYYWGNDPFRKNPGIYFTFWFVGEITEDAKQDIGTGMANELHFVTLLLGIEEALSKLRAPFSDVLTMGYKLWKEKDRYMSSRQ